MRTIPLGKSGLEVPAVAVGCMRITGLSAKEARRFVASALDLGMNFFDHADIYGGGECETLFAQAIEGVPRAKLLLQSKCGIRPGEKPPGTVRYDFSKAHILEAVDGILSRLQTDHLDVLLLHRPDALMEPEEVAEAFDRLQTAGKVRHFVFLQNPGQMRLLQKYVRQPLVANQLQFSVAHASMVTQGTHVNMLDEAAANRDGGVLDFCRLHDITIQPWSPFQHGFFKGPYIGSKHYKALNEKLGELAQVYNADATAIALAWILRHPAKMQPIAGTMNLARLQSCAKAAEITLTREDWYALYHAAGHTLP